VKAIVDISKDLSGGKPRNFEKLTKKDQIGQMVVELEMEMDIATQNLDFERAAALRDQIEELEARLRKLKK
jgi:excinuclease ABC subunit B